jgi:hypothetical protein
MEWNKTDPENLPKGRVIFTDGNMLDIGYFCFRFKNPCFETNMEYFGIENSYYIELPPLPEAK